MKLSEMSDYRADKRGLKQADGGKWRSPDEPPNDVRTVQLRVQDKHGNIAYQMGYYYHKVWREPFTASGLPGDYTVLGWRELSENT